MTQFALVITSNRCSGLTPVEEQGDDFLMGVASKLFSDSSIDKIYIIEVDGEDIDSLMLSAQRLVIGSSKFEETALYRVIAQVVQAVDELIFWYGSDYDDLEYVYDAPALLDKLEEAIKDSSCEIYSHYKKEK